MPGVETPSKLLTRHLLIQVSLHGVQDAAAPHQRRSPTPYSLWRPTRTGTSTWPRIPASALVQTIQVDHEDAAAVPRSTHLEPVQHCLSLSISFEKMGYQQLNAEADNDPPPKLDI